MLSFTVRVTLARMLPLPSLCFVVPCLAQLQNYTMLLFECWGTFIVRNISVCVIPLMLNLSVGKVILIGE